MYYLGNDVVDSIELKCFVVSRGAKVDKQVYQKYGKNTRLNPNPLMCNCMILSDETIVQLTDMSFHLKQLGSMLSWNNITPAQCAGLQLSKKRKRELLLVA